MRIHSIKWKPETDQIDRITAWNRINLMGGKTHFVAASFWTVAWN